MTSRIDQIGQNGNDGLHYPPTKKLVINWDEKPEWADVALEFPNSDVGTWCSGKDDKWVMDDDIYGLWWYKKEESPEYYIAHYPPLRCNLPTSSMTNSIVGEITKETGRCSDGRPCGEVHEFCQDAYCDGCPNDPLADLVVSFTPTAHSQVKQPRYQDTTGDDWIDECARTMTPDEFRGAMKFTIGKYIRRAGKKDDLIKEIAKVEDYARRWGDYERGLLE